MRVKQRWQIMRHMSREWIATTTSLAAYKADAAAHGWHIISDTSWDGYRIPLLIMAGYTLIGREVIDQLGSETLTHCFLPVGVGGLASGIVAPFWQHMNDKLPSMISVESHMSACFLESIAAQTPNWLTSPRNSDGGPVMRRGISARLGTLQSSLSHCLAMTIPRWRR